MPKLEPLLIVPDTHIPYHDVRAWNLMLKVAKVLKPKHLVCIGDLADFYSVSSHSKDPSRIDSLSEELIEVNAALDQLDALGATDKKFVEGNHEDRLRRYLQDKAPELHGVVGVEKLFNLKERGWHFTPYKKATKIGKCHFTHDVGTAGRFAAYRALERYQHTVVTGHTHRLSYIVEGNALGEYKLSATFGWLGDAAKVDYMHEVNVLSNWPLGFGIGYLNPTNGVVHLTPVPIVKHACVFNGTLFEG